MPSQLTNMVNEMDTAKEKEIKLIGSRAAQRIQKMETRINRQLHNKSMSSFIIDDEMKKKITSNLMQHVQNWNPVNTPHPMDSQRKSKQPYEKVRAFWNHKKASQLGTHLFTPVLSLLYKHLMSSMNQNIELLFLFIDILCDLLQEKIKFARTKELPLICCACFVKPNKFKRFSERFLAYFGPNIQYEFDAMTVTKKINGKSQTKYVRNSGRAKIQHQRYLKCMMQLKRQISNCHDIQFNIRKFDKWIVGDVSNQYPEPMKTNNGLRQIGAGQIDSSKVAHVNRPNGYRLSPPNQTDAYGNCCCDMVARAAPITSNNIESDDNSSCHSVNGSPFSTFTANCGTLFPQEPSPMSLQRIDHSSFQSQACLVNTYVNNGINNTTNFIPNMYCNNDNNTFVPNYSNMNENDNELNLWASTQMDIMHGM